MNSQNPNEENIEEKPKRKRTTTRKKKEVVVSEDSQQSIRIQLESAHDVMVSNFAEVGRYQKDISELSHKLNAIKRRCKISRGKRYYLSGRNCRKH